MCLHIWRRRPATSPMNDDHRHKVPFNYLSDSANARHFLNRRCWVYDIIGSLISFLETNTLHGEHVGQISHFFWGIDLVYCHIGSTRWTTSVAHSASTVLADIVRTIVIDKALAIAISLPSGKFDKCSTIFNPHGNFWAPLRNMLLNRFLQGFSDRCSKVTERKLRILQYKCFSRLFDEKN